MNVNNRYDATPVATVQNVAAQPKSPSSVPPPMGGGAATASISPGAQFFSAMQQLSQQNAASFKSVAAQVATSFQAAASKATGAQAQVLSGLASQFTAASKTGTLQPVQPTGSPAASQPQGVQGAQAGAASQANTSSTQHHHHHHDHGGGSSNAQQSSTVQQAFADAMGIVTNAK